MTFILGMIFGTACLVGLWWLEDFLKDKAWERKMEEEEEEQL